MALPLLIGKQSQQQRQTATARRARERTEDIREPMQNHVLALPEPRVDPIPANAGGDAADNVGAVDGSDSDSEGWGLLDVMDSLDAARARALTDENGDDDDIDSDFDLPGLSISDFRNQEATRSGAGDQHPETVTQIEERLMEANRRLEEVHQEQEREREIRNNQARQEREGILRRMDARLARFEEQQKQLKEDRRLRLQQLER